MAVFGCIWLNTASDQIVLKRAGGNRASPLRFHRTPGCFYGCVWLYVWMDMAVYGRIWLYMVVYGCKWPHMAVYGCLWLYLAVYGRICLYMAVYG